jgi:type IV pilus assembly protein PilA
MILPKTRAAGTPLDASHVLPDSRHLRHVADDGFTMVELAMVLVIMAILMAIAVPTFLGQARTANGRVAQANSDTALLDSQSTYLAAGQQFQPTPTMTSALRTSERNLVFTAAASANHSQVSVYVAPDRYGIIMAVQSNTTKDCWFTIMNGRPEPAANGTPYRRLPASELGAGTFFGEAKVPASGVAPRCQAAAVPAARAGSVAFLRGTFPHL